MNISLEHFAGLFLSWLADYYFAATLVLLAAFLAWRWMRQPAHRIVVAWTAVIELILLAVVCALPTWPKLSLIAARSSEPAAESPAVSARENALPPIRKERILVEKPAAAKKQETSNRSAAPVPASMILDSKELFSTGYLLCAAFIGVWLAGGAVATVRVCRRASAAPNPLHEQLSKIVRNRGRLPRLLVSTRVGSAVALGVLRPTIILPAGLADGGSETLRAILAHEWAHIRNRDLWLLAFGRCLLPLLFAHPLLWWLRRAIRVDQELLADALAAGDDRHIYAETLLALVRNSMGPSRIFVSAAVGIWEGPSQLSRRITMLLDDTFRIHPSGSRRWKLQAFGLMLVLGAACSLLTLTPAQSAEKKKDADKAGEKKTQSATIEGIGTLTIVGTPQPAASDEKDSDAKAVNNLGMGVWTVADPSASSAENANFPVLPGVEALSRPEIVDELKLTDDQKKSLEALRAKWSDFEKKIQEEMSKFGKDNPPPKEVSRDVEKKYQVLMESIRKDAQALLTPEQRKIIKEARLSENACWLLTEPAQLKENGLTDLTDDQKNRISDLHKQMIAKIEEAQKETKLKITLLFNKEQRAKLRDVLLQPEMSDSGRIEMYPLEKEGENLLIPTLRPYPDFSLPETQKALNLTETQMKLVGEILDGSKTLSEKFAREMQKLPPDKQKKVRNAEMGTLTLSAFSTYAFSGDASSAEEEATRDEVKRRKEAWEDWLKEPINKLSVELQNKFEASLTPEQLEKYKEMAFDSLHLYQIDDIAALHLAGASKEQKDAIRQTIIQIGKSDRESSVATGKKMLEVLTPEQRSKLSEAFDAASNRIHSDPFAEDASGSVIEYSGK